MSVVLVAVNTGLILGLLALGVFISYRIFDFPDITVDGSFVTGGAITAVLCAGGWNPVVATAAGAVGGGLAGLLTALLHTRLRINRLLAGILVMSALYSVNLRIMGRSYISLVDTTTLYTYAESWAARIIPSGTVTALGSRLAAVDLVILVLGGGTTLLFALLLRWFFSTHRGLAIRAAGDNDRMVRALGIGVEGTYLIGLPISNALAGLSGALLTQVQFFADIKMGIGMIVIGLASVILGQTLFGSGRFGRSISGAVLGSIVLRVVIAVIALAGIGSEDPKLTTAVFVVLALVLPDLLKRARAARVAT